MRWGFRAVVVSIAIVLALPGVAAAASLTSTGSVTITGTAQGGETLTCNNATWTPTNVGDPLSAQYTWFDGSTSGTVASGPSSSDTYTPTYEDGGIGQQLVCQVTETDTTSGDTGTAASGPTAAVVAGAAPTASSSPTTGGNPQVGQYLICNVPPATTTPAGDPIEDAVGWYVNGVLDTGPDAQGASYLAAGRQVGDVLACAVSFRDDTTGGVSTVYSATVTIEPTAAITITQYSAGLRGQIGENVAGVTVDVALQRPSPSGSPVVVASASTTTNSNGAWAATLAPARGVGSPSDVLVVAYSGTGPLPPSQSYSNELMFYGSDSTISPDGTTLAADTSQCSAIAFTVNGTSLSTSLNSQDHCVASTRATDNDSVAVAYTTPDSTAAASSNVTTVSQVGLLGSGFGEAQGVGAPQCDADLVSEIVTCSHLSAGQFAVADDGGAPVALAMSQGGGGEGGYGGAYTASVTLLGLRSNDTITLQETSPVVTTRPLTTLHVGTLREDLSTIVDPASRLLSGTTETGACSPGEYLDGANFACPASGSFPLATVGDQVDDLSGGQTTVTVPTLVDLIPAFDGTLAGGTFTAYADVGGSGTTAQLQSEVASVGLTISSRDGSSTAFSGTMTPRSDGAGPFESAVVSGVAQGRYDAEWTLTDRHGDTEGYTNLFAVEPADTGPSGPQGPAGTGAAGPQGSVGPQGPAGPAGPKGTTGTQGGSGAAGLRGAAGPRGPAGKSSVCTVKAVGRGRRKHQAISCKVISAAADVIRVELSRGKTIYAAGSATARAGTVRVRLRALRRIVHGRYLVTVVQRSGRKARVSRYHTTL